MIGVVLKTVQERERWALFVHLLRMHLKDKYRQGLPREFQPSVPPDTDEAARALLELLGENRSLLTAFRIAEQVETAIMTGQMEKAELQAVSRGLPDEGDLPNQHEMDQDYKELEPGATQTASTVEEVQIAIDVDEPPPPAGEEEKSAATAGADSDEDDEAFYDVSDLSDSASSASTEETVLDSHESANSEHADDGQSQSGARDSDDHGAGRGSESSEYDTVPSPVSLTSNGDCSSEHSVSLESAPSDPPLSPALPERKSDGEAHASEDEREAAIAAGAPNFRKCLERQAMLLTGCLKDLLDTRQAAPITVENLQMQLERFIFNPAKNVPVEHQEVRHNFYPPFLTPKAISNYHIFSITAPIPKSCKANRSGTKLWEETLSMSYYKYLPKWRPHVDVEDGLGTEVSAVGDLQDEVKMVPLVDDCSRLQWAKSRAEHVNFFSYPSLHFPPKIMRMLMETLLQPFVDETKNKAEEPAMCVTDEELACIVDPLNQMRPDERLKAMNTRRTMVTMAVRYCAQLELMQRVWREPSSIKKCQEVLHHTFHHGYVATVREVAKVNLSNYATYHGITYNNPLNNCIVAKLLEGVDKADFVIDTIYLFLVLNWQTAMGMWTQAITDETISIYAQMFSKWKRCIYSMPTIDEMTNTIVNILMDGDKLVEVMREGLPNFTTQTQISSFRHFLMERSNVPMVAAPFLPSDFVPLAFKESAPLLWDQVYLLRLACFLANHGGYLHEAPETSGAFKNYCPCNLCSPHRMPQDNVALHNEMLAINTFEIRSADGKTFKLTPELWTNAYLDKFVPKDFHPFTIFTFQDNQSRFSGNLTGCVTSSPEILSLIRQIQSSREEFMLTKGKGVYKDPDTGDVLSQIAPPPATGEEQAGLPVGKALPLPRANTPRRVGAAPKTVATVRPSAPYYLRSRGQAAAAEHGTENAGRESQSGGAGAGATRVPAPRVSGRGGGGHRRGVHRKRGHKHGFGGGRVGTGNGGQDDLVAITEEAQSENPKKILQRGSGSGEECGAEEQEKACSDGGQGEYDSL